MSGRLEMVDITSADVREETDIKGFYQHLIRCSRPRYRLVDAGSSAEIVGQTYFASENGVHEDLFDIDSLFYFCEMHVVTRHENVPEQFHGQVIRMYSVGRHAGYVKLYDEKKGKELQRSDTQLFGRGDVHGPALTISPASIREHHEIVKDLISPHDWLEWLERNKAIIVTNLENVSGVHSQCWPLEANEWITRKRIHGLPKKSTIRDVIRYGCDFAPISHKQSHDANEWRFSFSKAEVIIINSWTAGQRIAYRTLHLFNKMIKSSKQDSVLCTYYLKTLMLWATEEKPLEFWSEAVLVSSLFELLCKLIQWLKIKFCLNYFIPSNNMMDHFTDADVSATIGVTEAFYHLLQTTDTIHDLVDGIKTVEHRVYNTIYMVEAPIWIHASIMLFHQLMYGEDTEDTRITKSYPTRLQNMFLFEFLHIYKALGCQQEAGSCITQLDGHNNLSKSEKHFTNYIGSCEKKDNVAQTCSSRVLITFGGMFLMSNTSKSHLLTTSTAMDTAVKLNCINAEKAKINHKCFLYGRSMDEAGRTQVQRTNNFKEPSGKNEIGTPVAEYIKINTGVSEMSFKTFPGMSPTVGISWFINKAYLSNLYYTSQNDFHTTEEICDNVIYVSKQSVYNTLFSECFQVMLLTKWSAVWDKELQSILGLYSLCTFIFNKNNRRRSVYIGVCPVHFACYMKLCCAANQLMLEKWNKSFAEIKEHLKNCTGHLESKSLMHLAIAVTEKRFQKKFLLKNILDLIKILQEIIRKSTT